MDNYPHWHDLSPADIAASRQNDAVALSSIRAYDLTPPFHRVQPTAGNAAEAAARAERNRRARGVNPRTYKSRYVGVTVHRNRWIAQWGPKGYTKSAVFALDDAGELAAAWARATALGLSEPEVRPADVLIVAPEPAPVIEPHGLAKHRLGGQRIA